MPESFAAIIDDFNAVASRERLELLLDFAKNLPPLPQRYVDDPALLEPVPECQSPIYLVADVLGDGEQATVELHFSAPQESPTTSGFASILHEGLNGLSVSEVLGVPMDVSHQLGLGEAISPLRLRGMAGMLARVKHQVESKSGINER